MNYPMSVIKSVWRRVKKPSRNTMMNIECGEPTSKELMIPEDKVYYSDSVGSCCVNSTCMADSRCTLPEPDWYTPKPKRHGLARH